LNDSETKEKLVPVVDFGVRGSRESKAAHHHHRRRIVFQLKAVG
jgi:hypothetical protein